MTLAARTQRVQDPTRVDCVVLEGQNHVAAPPLRRPQVEQVDDSIVHSEARRAERANGDLDDPFDVVFDSWHVFDQHHLWAQNLGRPSHARIQSVSFVVTPRAVVQIGVALTWRAAEQDVHPADQPVDVVLTLRQLRTELAIKPTFNEVRMDDRRREVRMEYASGITTAIQR
jgi:hypothetical protein